MRVVVVEGSIGAGKTYFSSRAAKRCGEYSVNVPEEINPKLLELFYSNPKKYAFAFQLSVLETRTNGTRLRLLEASLERDEALSASSSSSGSNECVPQAYLDRSVLGDACFCVANYLQGNIDDAEMAVYWSVVGATKMEDVARVLQSTTTFNSSTSVNSDDGSVCDPTASGSSSSGDLFEKNVDRWLLYLHTSFDECKRRVDTHRRGVETSAGVPLSYFELLEQVYFTLLQHIARQSTTKMIVLDWKSYQDHRVAFDHLQKHFAEFVAKPPIDYSRAWCLPPADNTTGQKWQKHGGVVPDDISLERLEKIGMRWYTAQERSKQFLRWAEVARRHVFV
jgi:deoxyadenosine/deoxycytidine kinase